MHCTHKSLTVVKAIDRYTCGEWLMEWCSVCCAHEYLHECCVMHTCLLYIYFCCVFSGIRIFSSAVGDRVVLSLLLKNIPRIHSEMILAIMIYRRELPMISFILAHSLIDPVAVSVACCFSTCSGTVPMCESVAVYCLCLFSTPVMAYLQNSATLRLSSPYRAPACTSLFSDYLSSQWQSIVCYTDMPFVYRGF